RLRAGLRGGTCVRSHTRLARSGADGLDDVVDREGLRLRRVLSPPHERLVVAPGHAEEGTPLLDARGIPERGDGGEIEEDQRKLLPRPEGVRVTRCLVHLEEDAVRAENVAGAAPRRVSLERIACHDGAVHPAAMDARTRMA